ncbi:MAG: ATP-binding protein [Gammaproteobacteria bacterium]|nr:ATP-binding protein [Gammaproteobacteria bacterium]
MNSTGKDKSSVNRVGSIGYSSGANADLLIQNTDSAQYQVGLSNQQPAKCFYIPSHRPIFRYQAVQNIPTAKKTKQSAFDEVSNVNRNRVLHNHSHEPASFIMKNTLIGWAINGYGVTSGTKTIMAQDRDQIQYFEGFQETLRKILPKSLGFKEFEIRNMEIVFVCNDGADEFLLETASGGVSALIDIAWQIYMFSSKDNPDFTVIIDEIENHLHPTMQRRILPDLLRAFPVARFVVSTHSPLIVGSVKDSSIYALAYNSDNKIQSRYLDFMHEAKTASEVLDEVLGVSFTMPVWVEEELERIIAKYSRTDLTKEDFISLRKELSEFGLEKMVPFAIQGLVEGNSD